jgi:hypothetical protein
MDFTVHLRAGEIGGQYLASATVYYYEQEPPNPEGEKGEPENQSAQLPTKIKVVDEPIQCLKFQLFTASSH